MNAGQRFFDFIDKAKGCASIAAGLIAIATFFGGSTYFYNEIVRSKNLVFTVLPNYDIGPGVFSGVLVNNEGRVTLTEVQIIISDLEHEITALNMPGAHEPANIVEGGIGENKLRIEMPRLSSGASLSIYLVTNGEVSISDDQSLFVSSSETVGERETANLDVTLDLMIITIGILLIFIFAIERLFIRMRPVERAGHLGIDLREPKE